MWSPHEKQCYWNDEWWASFSWLNFTIIKWNKIENTDQPRETFMKGKNKNGWSDLQIPGEGQQSWIMVHRKSDNNYTVWLG